MTTETVAAALISFFAHMEDTMETYHCPECKKAVTKERIQTLPWYVWLMYLAFAPQPFPPGAVAWAGSLLLLSLVLVHGYYRRHP